MVERLERTWRVCATGFCFSCFGLGGLLMRVLVFPAMTCFVRSASVRQRVCKELVRYAFRVFVWLMTGVGVMRCEVRHADRLRRSGLLIVANHPSLIDVVLLIAQVRRADCVVKADLLRNPFTRGPVRATGYVCNSSGAGMVDDCIASLRAGNNLVIFPEGTRTPLHGPLRLQRGAANIAVRGGRALTPVVIRCEPPTLTKGEKWYRVPVRRPRYVIEVHEDLAVADCVDAGANESQAVRQLTCSLSEFFSRELRREGT